MPMNEGSDFPRRRQATIGALPALRSVTVSRHRTKRQRGFSLLEVLMAFAIMGIALGILLQIFSSGVNTAVVAEDYTVATQIAEGLMATAGVETPLMVGENEGVEQDKYRWRVSIEELAPLPGVEQNEAVLLEVRVSVQWGGEDNGRRVELNTIKAAGPVS